MSYPVLYTFRRCPYAIRARMALEYSGILVEHREILLSNKPEQMLKISPKGSVPVLVLQDLTVIDESLDIMNWALSISDPDKWLINDIDEDKRAQKLIQKNDCEFKNDLDHYKYADRYPEKTVKEFRTVAEKFIYQLEVLLYKRRYITGSNISIVDIAIFPFIRQFAHVDKRWFDDTQYHNVQNWLDGFLESTLFSDVMLKHKVWKE